MTTLNKWKRHVKTTTTSLYKRQIALIESYKRNEYVESTSSFIRKAIDDYIPRFEKLIELAKIAEKEKIKDQSVKDKEFLEKNKIRIIRKLESPPEAKVYY